MKRLPDLLFWVPTAAFIALWHLASVRIDSVPSPLEVLRVLIALLRQQSSYRNLTETVVRAISSFLVAAIIGLCLGTIGGTGKRLGEGLTALIDFLRSIPAPA